MRFACERKSVRRCTTSSSEERADRKHIAGAECCREHLAARSVECGREVRILTKSAGGSHVLHGEEAA